jgi:uncharacterized protein with HEPN domain
MPSRPDLAIGDILEAVEGIEAAVADRTFEEFAASWLLRHAVQRGLEIISEASRRLPESIKGQHPDVPWTDIAGIGNVLRHDYHRVSDRIVWATVKQHLGPLKQALSKPNN